MHCCSCRTVRTAKEICDALKLARSNVSTGLRELQSYGLVRLTHNPGDRRDHFVAEVDPWEMLMRITAERKRREVDPTIDFAQLSDRLSRDRAPHPTCASASSGCTR